MATPYSIGPPTAACVPPGQCVFGTEWTPSSLLSKVYISHDVISVKFSLPESDKPLNLSTCACLLLYCGPDEERNPIIRPYTPVSTNATKGEFELLVKVYDKGKATQYMNTMAIGEWISVKHIPVNVKIQHPFGKQKIGMLVGGTGITPMIQACHAILGTPGDTTTVSMLFGNREVKDILAKDPLDSWSKSHSDRFTVTHVLSNEAADSDWKGERGFINESIVQKYLPSPSDDCLLFVCGPPPMYKALCGPREEKELTGLLGKMGYRADQVYKF